MRAEEKASREMKKLAFVACLATALAYGADVVYLPYAKENGIYDWRTVGNWYTVGGGALGALPTASDNVYVTNATFATEWLVIPADADVSVNAIFLQKQYNASSSGVQMRIDGGKLTTSSNSHVGSQGIQGILSIENGGLWTASGEVYVGYGSSANSQLRISEGSTLAGTGLTIQYGGGTGAGGNLTGLVENHGTLTLSGALRTGHRDKGMASNHRSRLENYGTFSCASTATIGRAPRSHSTIINHVDATMTFTSFMIMGYCTNATGVLVNDGTLSCATFYAGGVTGSTAGSAALAASAAGTAGTTAYVTNNGDMTVYQCCVAYQTNSFARLRNNGTLRTTNTGTIQLGWAPNSDGEIANYGTLDLATVQLNVGYYGRGRLEVGADMNFAQKAMYVGVNVGGDGSVAVTNGATLTMTDGRLYTTYNNGCVGGRIDIYEGASIVGLTNLIVGVAASAHGCLYMRGGEVLLKDNAGAWLCVGRNSRTAGVSSGRIEGWGTVGKTEPAQGSGNHKIQMRFWNGVVQADGDGTARDLDFRLVQDMNDGNVFTNPCGTNGWYAVGKGRLRYPARSHGRGTARIIGDCATRTISTENLPLVNSFGVTFPTTDDQMLSNRCIYADMYAPDRADIPAGLPAAYPGAMALGVWQMALSTDGTEPKASKKVTGFGSADIMLHYDRAKLVQLKQNGAWPSDLQLAFCVHDGTAAGGWRTVALVEPDDNSPFISGRVTESSETWNLGWFAVVPVRQTGTMLIFR